MHPQARGNGAPVTAATACFAIALRHIVKLPWFKEKHWPLQGHFRGCSMGGPNSKQSRALADVRKQLSTGKTRGVNPRKLTADETRLLEQRAAQLQVEMAEARYQRSLTRKRVQTSARFMKRSGIVAGTPQPSTKPVPGNSFSLGEPALPDTEDMLYIMQKQPHPWRVQDWPHQ